MKAGGGSVSRSPRLAWLPQQEASAGAGRGSLEQMTMSGLVAASRGPAHWEVRSEANGLEKSTETTGHSSCNEEVVRET